MNMSCSQCDKKLKLLIVGAFPTQGRNIFGGIATVCRALLSTSFRDAFELVLVDSTQLSNPPPGIVTRGTLAFVRFARYCQAVVRERPDGVLLFAAIGASLIEKGAMAVVARAVGIPVAIFPRGGAVMDTVANKGRWSWIFAAALKTGDRFFCQGQKWHEFATKELGYKSEHAPVIQNWSATAELLDIGARRRSRDSNTLRVVFVGWLEKEKGVGELIAACGRLLNRYDFNLTIAGDGRFASHARELASKHGLTPRVSFNGWVEPGDVPALLENADIFALPSYAEGLPNALIEAMAAGLPVIVTTVGTVPLVISDGHNGLLVPPRDATAIECSLATLFADEELRRELGKNAHATAKELFSVEPAMRKLTTELNKMMLDKSPAACGAAGLRKLIASRCQKWALRSGYRTSGDHADLNVTQLSGTDPHDDRKEPERKSACAEFRNIIS